MMISKRYYSITLYRSGDEGEEDEVIHNGIASPDPMHALRRMGNMFIADGGFGRFTKVVCADQETGVVQWELIIQ